MSRGATFSARSRGIPRSARVGVASRDIVGTLAPPCACVARSPVSAMRLRIRPSLPAGTAIVMAPDACAILDRVQTTVMLGFSADDFTRNLVTILAEARAGFAVFSPGAVFKFTPAF